MTTPMAQKKLRVYDAQPVGAVCQSPVNLETMTQGQWIALDGRDCIRSQYPEIQSMFPAGVFTSTARALAATSNAPTIVADNTNFLTPGAAGTSALQASPTGGVGSDWVQSATWGASTAVKSIVVAGTRYVIAGTAGDMSAPYVYATGNTAANTVAKANWTATTGGASTTLTQGLAYGSTANAGAGRTVLCINGSQATATGLFYMNDAATAWNACSGGSTQTRQTICWSGQKFFVFMTTGTLYQVSSDGATFADAYLPVSALQASFAPLSCASDGNGTIVLLTQFAEGAATSLVFGALVSKDHGATWRTVQFPEYNHRQIAVLYFVKYANGKFFAGYGGATGTVFVSSDGLNWFSEPITGGRGILIGMYDIAYKAGVYCGNGYNATDALTATEDMSKFRIPKFTINHCNQSNGEYVLPSTATIPVYMKARSN